MKPIATFNIDGSFKITGRGLVIYGDLLDGKIIHDNFLAFDIDTKEIILKIKGIDFMDNLRTNVTKVGLTFYYDNVSQMEYLQTLKVTKQTATIFEDDL